ncbi:hypothetical protein, partial [Meiothermus hypogaeus]|uniref:hypothetical protein n=1 Tax=Meiothermus hypogaeus TaxID=884155 RepID=UPI001C99C28E
PVLGGCLRGDPHKKLWARRRVSAPVCEFFLKKNRKWAYHLLWVLGSNSRCSLFSEAMFEG